MTPLDASFELAACGVPFALTAAVSIFSRESQYLGDDKWSPYPAIQRGAWICLGISSALILPLLGRLFLRAVLG